MTYTLTRELLAEQQPVVDGMCLADWQELDGFAVDDPDTAAQLIHPKIVAARTAGLLRSLAIERPGDSGNAGYAGVRVPSPCMHVVLHWWGTPVGQSHDGVVAWLRNPVSQVSAHYVASPGRVTQILPLTTPSWANGNYAINATTITIEADPNDVPGTIMTIVELLVQLVRDGALHPDYRLSGHRDHYSTACPGTYYPRLGAIRTAATTRLTANTTQEEDDMPKLTDKVRLANGETTYAEAIRLNDANQQRLIADVVAVKKTVEDLLAREAQWAPVNFTAILQRLDEIDAKLGGAK